MKMCDFDYRIYDKIEKRYCETNDIFLTKNGAGCNLELFKVRKNDFGPGLEKLKPNTYEIELFTGLRDKIGWKIFENDLVKCEFSTYDEELDDYKYSYKTLRVIYVEHSFYLVEFLDGFKKEKVSPSYIERIKRNNSKLAFDLVAVYNSTRYHRMNIEERFEVISNIHEELNNA